MTPPHHRPPFPPTPPPPPFRVPVPPHPLSSPQISFQSVPPAWETTGSRHPLDSGEIAPLVRVKYMGTNLSPLYHDMFLQHPLCRWNSIPSQACWRPEHHPPKAPLDSATIWEGSATFPRVAVWESSPPSAGPGNFHLPVRLVALQAGPPRGRRDPKE